MADCQWMNLAEVMEKWGPRSSGGMVLAKNNETQDELALHQAIEPSKQPYQYAPKSDRARSIA